MLRLPFRIVSLALMIVASFAAATGATNGLVGIGATKAAFAANHQADPNPKLVPGCCFLPKERGGGDHIITVSYASRRVFSYEIDYAPNASLATADAELARELPPDAKLVYQVRKSECEMRQYKSITLSRIDGPLKESAKQKKLDALLGGKEQRGLVDVGLYSSESGPYNGRSVESILIRRGYNAADKTTGC